MVMLKPHVAELSERSYAVHEMAVNPTGNTVCVNGVVQETKVTPTLSVAVPSDMDGARHEVTPLAASLLVG